MVDKLTNIEKSISSIETSLRWHKRLILGLYALLGVFVISSFPKGSASGFVSITGLSILNNHQEVMNMDWQPLLIVGAALVRSVLGWAKASFKDGYIQDYEFKKLGETVVRVSLIGFIVAYLPWINVTWFETAAIALGGDVLLNLVRKRKIETTEAKPK